jgi:DNA-binding MarR family transcriptional regulator
MPDASQTDGTQLEEISAERRRLANVMVQVLPAFGRWASGIRDFETPLGKIGYRQVEILYVLRYRVLGSDTVPPSALASWFGIQPSVVTRVLGRLESAGFISRTPDPTDARSHRVALTERGMAVSIQIEEMLVKAMVAGMTSVDEDDLGALNDSLEKLTRVIIDLERQRRRAQGRIVTDSTVPWPQVDPLTS